jgi:hypothetical protein
LTASFLSGYCSEGADRDRSMSGDSAGLRFRPSRRMYSQQSTQDQDTGLPWIAETVTTEMTEVEVSPEVTTIIHSTDIEETIETNNNVQQVEGFLGVPSSISASGSADTLVPSAPTSPSNVSNVTLVGSTGSGGDKNEEASSTTETIVTIVTASTAASSLPFKYGIAPTAPLPERVIPKRPPRTIEQQAASIVAESITTISQSQQLPQTTTSIKSAMETRPSIIKIAPTPPTIAALTNIVTLTTSTLFSTSASASTTTKTSITTPSIGVSFDR